MNGTKHSKVDSNRSVPSYAGATPRVTGFSFAVLIAVALVVWLELTAWRQSKVLRAEMAAVHTESFYLGLHLRSGIWRLDGRLLRFQLSEEPAERDEFQRESRDLSLRIERSRPRLTTERERELVRQMEIAYTNYLVEVAPLLEKGIRGIRRNTTGQLARDIAGKSAEVLRVCDELVGVQQEAWQSVVGESQRSLQQLERVMHTLALLLLLLLVLIFILGYRTFIVPLRTRLDENQDVMRRQEKLVSLGTFAAGAAHEIRNPLAAMKFHLFSLKNSVSPALAEGEDVQVIESEIDRLERIVKDFLDFARPSEPELQPVPAEQIFNEVHDLLRAQLEKQSIRLTIEPGDPARINVDKGQIKQVLINLVQNAGESIGQNGVIRLRVRRGIGRVDKGSGPVTILEVSDSGAGIPPEVEARLFEPFFSTREGGTGLGLSIASRIVEKHGGHLQYQSDKTGGATFSIVLPRYANDEITNPAH